MFVYTRDLAKKSPGSQTLDPWPDTSWLLLHHCLDTHINFTLYKSLNTRLFYHFQSCCPRFAFILIVLINIHTSIKHLSGLPDSVLALHHLEYNLRMYNSSNSILRLLFIIKLFYLLHLFLYPHKLAHRIPVIFFIVCCVVVQFKFKILRVVKFVDEAPLVKELSRFTGDRTLVRRDCWETFLEKFWLLIFQLLFLCSKLWAFLISLIRYNVIVKSPIILLYSLIHLTLLDFTFEMLDQLLQSFCVLHSNHVE